MAEDTRRGRGGLQRRAYDRVPPPSRPRDQAGKFVETRGAPEQMFAPREVEGGSRRRRRPRPAIEGSGGSPWQRKPIGTTYTGPSPRVQQGLGLTTTTTPSSPTRSAPSRGRRQRSLRAEAAGRRRRKIRSSRRRPAAGSHAGRGAQRLHSPGDFPPASDRADRVAQCARGGPSASAGQLAADDAGQGGVRERRPDDDAARAQLGSGVPGQPARGASAAEDLPGFVREAGAESSRSARRWRRSMRRRRIDGWRNMR